MASGNRGCSIVESNRRGGTGSTSRAPRLRMPRTGLFRPRPRCASRPLRPGWSSLCPSAGCRERDRRLQRTPAARRFRRRPAWSAGVPCSRDGSATRAEPMEPGDAARSGRHPGSVRSWTPPHCRSCDRWRSRRLVPPESVTSPRFCPVARVPTRVVLVVTPWGASLNRCWRDRGRGSHDGRCGVVPAFQRYTPPAGSSIPALLASSRGTGARRRGGRRANGGSAVDDLRWACARRLRRKPGRAEGAARGCRPPCRRRLPFAEKRRARGVARTCCARSWSTDRHAGSPRCSSSRSRSSTACSSCSSPRRAPSSRSGIPSTARATAVEALRAASMEADSVGLWDGLRAVTRLAHAGCRAGELTGHRVQRPLVLTGAHAAGRTARPGRRGGARRDRGPVHASGGRRRREGAHLVSRPRRGAARGGVRDAAGLCPARRTEGSRTRAACVAALRIWRPQGHRHVLHAPVACRLPAARHPGTARARGDTRTDSRTQRCSTRPWAAARSSSVPAAISPAAYESALVDCGRCHPTDIGPAERASIRRLIAERCLFGVDINPTAVQLARLSLWLTTLAADRRSRSSIITCAWATASPAHGCRVSATRQHARVLSRRCRCFRTRSPPTRFATHCPSDSGSHWTPNDTAAQVRAKERAMASLTSPDSPLAKWTRVANLWCASWLASPPMPPSAFAELSDAILTGPTRAHAGAHQGPARPC